MRFNRNAPSVPQWGAALALAGGAPLLAVVVSLCCK
jgi:hypothetical protein